MADPIDDKPRCFGSHTELYAYYHDTEWGVPVQDDQMLFEMLILEGHMLDYLGKRSSKSARATGKFTTISTSNAWPT